MHTLKYPAVLTALFCLLATSGPARQAAVFNGIVAGNMSVNPNGAANYTIPLDVPPGINGFQPSLQLVYSSQGNNGLAGTGFSLEGFSAITRTGATVPQDGFRGGINYDANDRFALDGNRLMAVNTGGTYFNAGATYYTEMQSWSKIVAGAASGQGPGSFTVYQKDGSAAQYGNGNGSQVLAQGPVFKGSLAGSVRTWLISRMTNNNGNYLDYFYTASPKNFQGMPMTGSATDGTAYSDVIYYHANGAGASRKIQFLYEPRTDTLVQYAGGASNRLSVRLKAIQSFTINGTDTAMVNTYLLTYDTAAPLQVSRIVSVVKLGRNGGSTSPVSFTWTDGANGLAGTRVSWDGPISNAGFEGDFNGDGKTDLMPVNNYTISGIYFAGSNGFVNQRFSSILVTATTYVSDYNGDGLPDLLVLKTAGTGQLYFCNGRGFNSPVPLSGLQYNTNGKGVWIADFNGDGRADIFSVTGSAGYVCLANGNGFDPYRQVSGLSLQLNQTFVADFNGDGQADIFSGGYTGGQLYLSDFSHTSSFQPAITTGGITLSNTYANNMVADFNSDGLTDILTHTNNQYNLYYANGHGFDTAVAITNVNLNVSQNWLSDFNGDGRMDFYALTGSTATVYYFYANRFQSQPKTSPALISNATWTGDFNGDGIADLFAANTGTIYYSTNTAQAGVAAANQVPNLVTGINNGINGTITIDYRPMTDTAVYRPGNSNAGFMEGLHTQNNYNPLPLSPSQLNPYPFVHTQSALYVVQQYTLSCGLGNPYSYAFQYAGSLTDIQAYGWLGFNTVTITDTAGQNRLVANYLQPYPLTGRQQRAMKTDLYGNLLLQQRSEYHVLTSALPLFQSRVFQVQTRATRSDYFDYGVFAYTTGVNYRYDNYGNVTTLVQLNDTAETNNTVYTINAYLNDTTGWHIGYLQSSLQSPDSAGNKILKQTNYRYDPATYQVTLVSAWLNTGNTWLNDSYGYDVYGNQVMQVDAAGDTTRTTYDSPYHSFPVSQVSPPNQWGAKLVNTMVYNPAFGKIQSATDANGNTTQVLSDQFGRDSVITGPDSTGQPVVLSAVLYYADGTGYTEQHLDRDDWGGSRWDTSEVVYDGMQRNYMNTWRGQNHQLVTQLNRYNSHNDITWKSLPFFTRQQPQGTVFQYDPYQRVVSVTVPAQDGRSVTSLFSYQGKQVTIHSAAGTSDSTTSYQSFDYYNGQKRDVQRTDESGLVTRFAYTLLGKPLRVTDPAGLSTTYTHNSLGDITATTNSSAGHKNFFYNYTGNTVAAVNNTGDTVTNCYDRLKRIISTITPSGVTAYQYDLPGVKNGLANLCKVIMEDTAMYYAYQYDAYHNKINASLQAGGHNYAETFSFNPGGANSSITYPDSSVAYYSYYDNGYLQQITMADAEGTGVATPYATCTLYDAAGDQQAVSYGNGLQRIASFNPFGRMNSFSIGSPGAQPLLKQHYTWNSVNNITSITDSLNTSHSQYFSYLPNGRLVRAQGAYGPSVYGYDTAGNITTNDSVILQYNNYQVTAGFKNHTKLFSNLYDGNGNLSKHTAYNGQDSLQVQYVFNALNRLTAILSGADTLFSFVYNPEGQRLVQKNYRAGVTIYYISPQYEVTVTADSVFNTRYVCSPGGLVAAVTHGTSLSGPAAVNATAYLHQDLVHSTLLTTGLTGAVSSQVDYMPFGQPYTISGDTARYLFGSKQLDASGLYYFSSRYYDPLTARFITADNVTGGGRLQTDAYNRYAYTLNNPVKYYDPSGHAIGTIVLLGLQFLADIFSEGLAAPEEVAVDEALAARAAEEVGEHFLNALSTSRVSGAINDAEAVKIYKTVRGLANLEPLEGDWVATNSAGKLADRYGNIVFRNGGATLLEDELEFREMVIDAGKGDDYAYTQRNIGRILNGNRGIRYKYVLSASDYTISIGNPAITHAAIEGAGNDAYTAGFVTLQRDGTLNIDFESGHYKPTKETMRMSEPLWYMMKNRGYLNFDRIEYAQKATFYFYMPEDIGM